MIARVFPLTQGELIRVARAEMSQAAFARLLGVDRSCLSRYESEVLGAPTLVINACLRKVAQTHQAAGSEQTVLHRSLKLARELVNELETVSTLHDPSGG
jgi:DNA-binding XRE family transcriptional regulator